MEGDFLQEKDMKNILIVYCHPSDNSFTFSVKEEFVRGLQDAGNTYEISDLYTMGFNPVMSEEEYLREAFYDNAQAVPDEILAEQKKIQEADSIVFIYPVFWTEAPAALVGWFQRVWTYGFAYGDDATMKKLEKALFLVTMGGSLGDPIRVEQVHAMQTVMLGDRINERAETTEMIIVDEMTRGYGNEKNRIERGNEFLSQAYRLGFEM